MEELIHFYEMRMETYKAVYEQLNKKIHLLGTLRLLLFLCALVVLWLCRDDSWSVLCLIILAFALPFVVLMMYHTRLYAQRDEADRMLQLNADERKALDYDFSAFDGDDAQIDAQHSFSMDLDVFGKNSLFQSLNRTITSIGQVKLSEWLKNPLKEKSQIRARQQAVKELSGKTDFRQRYYVKGVAQKGFRDGIVKLRNLAGQTTHFSGSWLWLSMIWILPLAWVLLIVGYVLGWFPVSVLGLMFVISFLVANIPARGVNTIYKSVNRMEKVLLSYSQLMEQVEQEQFQSELLAGVRQKFLSRQKASKAVKLLSRTIGALDQRYSVAGILLNVFYMRDLRETMNLERWIVCHLDDFDEWFDALAQMDAFCSLGGFAFNHPDYPYPTIADAYFQMEGQALGHPLLHRDQCVHNDISIAKNPYFLVITGANMAGKSTYLRTVGVNFLLACVGLPVCARSLSIYPASLVTSLRTADSLTANESYFFAELKRLKMIIDRLEKGEQLFIILDEILKGTNSKDKQKGSFALVKQLIDKQSCGIIATHDLLLGSLAQEYPDEVHNYCFEAEIDGDKLSFSYHLQEGVAQNMNASILMKKMGITIS